jgi:thiamine biosynthesis protein ThiS
VTDPADGSPATTLAVTINGERHVLPDGTSVAALLELHRLDARFTAVERNAELVPKSRFASTRLADGDRLEIVTLVGGG